LSGDDGVNLLWGVGALVLVISALAAHRLRAGQLIRSLATWGAIGLVVWVGVANRHHINALVANVSSTLGLDEQQVAGETVRIRMAPDGHFWARVSLNGVERRMLVDSGATTTAISQETAQAAGVATDANGFPVMIETANGTVEARRGRIERLGVGPLHTDDLGVVVSEAFGSMDVLGMNFLSRLKSWRVEGNVLVLEPGSGATDAGADATAKSGRVRADDGERVPERKDRERVPSAGPVTFQRQE
jgi:aspartyl protease family protein